MYFPLKADQPCRTYSDVIPWKRQWHVRPLLEMSGLEVAGAGLEAIALAARILQAIDFFGVEVSGRDDGLAPIQDFHCRHFSGHKKKAAIPTEIRTITDVFAAYAISKETAHVIARARLNKSVASQWTRLGRGIRVPERLQAHLLTAACQVIDDREEFRNDNIMGDTGRQTAKALLDLLQYPGMEYSGMEYPGMEEYEGNGTYAFESTVRWVFEDSANENRENLPKWLRDSSGMYLISGNSGTGKSTWMKYILGHQKTTENLNVWAGPNCLIRSHFFFWWGSSPLRRSEEGLWRALIHKALSQQPLLMPSALPREWAMLYLQALGPSGGRLLDGNSGSWGVQKLKDAALRLTFQRQSKISWFIAIDAIDEADKDLTKNVDFITKSLTTLGDIKLLMAARTVAPYDKIKASLDLSMDANKVGIESYIRARIEGIEQIRAVEPRLRVIQEEMIKMVSKHTQGMFLKADLALKELERRAQHGDLTSSLERIEPTLLGLYDGLWRVIQPKDREVVVRAAELIFTEGRITSKWPVYQFRKTRVIDLVLSFYPSEKFNERKAKKSWRQVRDELQKECSTIAEAITSTNFFVLKQLPGSHPKD